MNPESAGRSTIPDWVVVTVLSVAGFIVSMAQSLVIPIQLDLPRLLSVTAADASWVVTATLLGAATAMPVAGRAADVYGKRPALVGCAAALLIGSLASAVSNSLAPMVLGRFLQGVAIGYIPVAISLVYAVVGRSVVNSAVAAISAMLGAGAGLGLPIAAWLASRFEWHSLFWMSAVLAAILLVLTAALLPAVPIVSRARMDFIGAVGIVIGLGALLIAMSKGNDWGWLSYRVLAAVAIGMAILAMWIVYQLRVDDPLIDVRVSASRPVLLTNLAALMVGFGMMAEGVMVPQLMATPSTAGFGLGLSVLEIGLWMAPAGIAATLCAPLCGMLITRVGARITLALGSLLMAIGYFSACGLTAAPWQLLIATTIIASGVGLGYAAMPTLILRSVPATQAGSGVGLNGLMRQGGCAIAAAIMTVILTASLVPAANGDAMVPSHNAYYYGFIVSGITSVLGIVLALAIRTSVGATEVVQLPAGR